MLRLSNWASRTKPCFVMAIILTFLVTVSQLRNLLTVEHKNSLRDDDTESRFSIQDTVMLCVTKISQEQVDLKAEIAHYENMRKFKEKIKEVQGERPIAVSHAAIQKYLGEKVLDPNWSVLELGCAAGMMLKVVRDLYRNGIGNHSDLVGVELVTGWVKFAQEFFVGENDGIHVF